MQFMTVRCRYGDQKQLFCTSWIFLLISYYSNLSVVYYNPTFFYCRTEFLYFIRFIMVINLILSEQLNNIFF